MKKFFVIFLMITSGFAAVSDLSAVSQSAVPFLLISPGARAAGMGEAFVGLADDATAVFWNSAGLAFQTGREIILMHSNWLPQLVSDMSYEFLAYRQYFESLGGTIGGNITFLNMGEQVQTGEGGPTPIGTFRSWDMAVSLSYATRLTKNLGIGLAMRYIRSNLSPVGAGEEKGNGVGNAFAVDIGVLYKFTFLKGFSFGANLSNMGPKITYVDAAQASPLPTNLKIGFAYKILDMEYNKLTITMDTNKLLVVAYSVDENGNRIDDVSKLSEEEKSKLDSRSDPFYKAIFTTWKGSFKDQLQSLISSCGVEYAYNNMILLRAGYYYDEEGDVMFPSFGAGLQYSQYRFDFAYVSAKTGHPLSNTMRFSLTAEF